jgi:hypothetical protein
MMVKGNYRFKIETLLQIARVTTDEELREEILAEALELLDAVDTNTRFSASDYSTIHRGETYATIQHYLANTERDRVSSVVIWEEALGLDRKDMKGKDSRFILSVLRQSDGWREVGKQRCGDSVLRCFDREKVE